jgi:hypothetical protein
MRRLAMIYGVEHLMSRIGADEESTQHGEFQRVLEW